MTPKNTICLWYDGTALDAATIYVNTIRDSVGRAVYHSTRVDQEIPASLYNAVAQVLSHVMQLKAYQAGRGKAPRPLANLPVPAHLSKEKQ